MNSSVSIHILRSASAICRTRLFSSVVPPQKGIYIDVTNDVVNCVYVFFASSLWLWIFTAYFSVLINFEYSRITTVLSLLRLPPAYCDCSPQLVPEEGVTFLFTEVAYLRAFCCRGLLTAGLVCLFKERIVFLTELLANPRELFQTEVRHAI